MLYHSVAVSSRVLSSSLPLTTSNASVLASALWILALSGGGLSGGGEVAAGVGRVVAGRCCLFARYLSFWLTSL